MAKREKKKIISGISREQMEDAFGRFATADAEIQKINAEMDAQMVEIRESNADRLAELEAEKAAAFEEMQAFATENRDELFTKRKSMETVHGVLGFRTGQPKLKTKKGFTWAAILELLKVKGRQYIRLAEEVAKDKLLAERDEEETRLIMDNCGIQVVQEETFYVEPKKEAQ